MAPSKTRILFGRNSKERSDDDTSQDNEQEDGVAGGSSTCDGDADAVWDDHDERLLQALLAKKKRAQCNEEQEQRSKLRAKPMVSEYAKAAAIAKTKRKIRKKSTAKFENISNKTAGEKNGDDNNDTCTDNDTAVHRRALTTATARAKTRHEGDNQNLRKAAVNNAIQEVAKGRITPFRPLSDPNNSKRALREYASYLATQKPRGGRPRTIKTFAFGGTMYRETALSIFYWPTKIETSRIQNLTQYPIIETLCAHGYLPTCSEADIPGTVAHEQRKLVLTKRDRDDSGDRDDEESAEKKPRKNIQWPDHVKILLVESFQDYLVAKRCPFDHDDETWKKQVTKHVNFMKKKNPSTFTKVAPAHLFAWYQKFRDKGIEGLVDGRCRNCNAAVLPTDLKHAIQGNILDVLGKEIEVKPAVLKPAILEFCRQYKNGKYAHLLEKREDNPRYFRASESWIKQMLKEIYEEHGMPQPEMDEG